VQLLRSPGEVPAAQVLQVAGPLLVQLRGQVALGQARSQPVLKAGLVEALAAFAARLVSRQAASAADMASLCSTWSQLHVNLLRGVGACSCPLATNPVACGGRTPDKDVATSSAAN
jgi:LDH2 family malate/lactate/ureidoglycolate dehydrogenase